MRAVLGKMGRFLWAVVKVILKIIITMLQIGLEFLKVVLLLFGLIARIFLAFVRAGTP